MGPNALRLSCLTPALGAKSRDTSNSGPRALSALPSPPPSGPRQARAHAQHMALTDPPPQDRAARTGALGALQWAGLSQARGWGTSVPHGDNGEHHLLPHRSVQVVSGLFAQQHLQSTSGMGHGNCRCPARSLQGWQSLGAPSSAAAPSLPRAQLAGLLSGSRRAALGRSVPMRKCPTPPHAHTPPGLSFLACQRPASMPPPSGLLGVPSPGGTRSVQLCRNEVPATWGNRCERPCRGCGRQTETVASGPLPDAGEERDKAESLRGAEAWPAGPGPRGACPGMQAVCGGAALCSQHPRGGF